MRQQLIGVILIMVGVYFEVYAFKKRRESNIYATTRTISGGILAIFIGIMLLIKKW